MKFKLFTAAAFLAPVPCLAGVEDFQGWNSINLATAVAKKVPASLEVSGRMIENAGRLGVFVVRPAIGYQFSNTVTAFVGYTHQITINDGVPDVTENRIHQQLNLRVGTIGNAVVSSRTRFEQRWIQGARDLGLRLRERLQLQVPLKKAGTNFVLSSEILFALNTTDWGARAGFDQMRNFAGLSIPLNRAVVFETGYQNRYQKRFGAPDRVDHIIPVTLNIKI